MQLFHAMKKTTAMCLALLVLMFGLVSRIQSQGAGTGSIEGTVKDPNGLLVPGAAVIIRNVETGAERNLTTNEAGLYSAPYLQPGHYEVRVRKQGFAEVVHQDFLLEVGKTLAVDFDLPLKGAQETVTVTSEVGLVETDKMEVSQTIDQFQVENLPLNGRRWDNLVLGTPGVNADGGFGGVSFRGISSLYNNNMVDGADNNQAFFSEARGRTRIAYGYSMNAIKEFNVTTAAYTAEFGRAAGGVVNAVTKSGTNDWHGDAFYFIRDDVLLARDPIAKARGNPKPDERRQQFGGAFGGPLIHDRLFFFLNYDRQKRNFPAVITPNSQDFFDPTSSGSQAANCKDANCPAVLAALQPLFNGTNPRQGNQQLGLAKADYQWNSNNRISGVFNILRWESPNGIFTGPTLNTSSLTNGTDGVNNEFITVTWNRTLSSASVNEARFQYGRDFESQIPNASGPSIGLTGAADFGMPNFLPRGAFPNEKRYQWVDNLSWIRGRHQFKTGADINYVRDNIQNLFQGGGVYSYTGTQALNHFAQDLRTGSKSYDNFSQAADPITGSGQGFFTTTDLNFYFQDNIKLRPNLTVNLGLRYELQTMPGIVKANPLVPENATLNTDTNNFGPRVGFSWSPGKGQKQVIRGGYGIYYGRTQNSSIFVHLFQNGVFQQTFNFSPTAPGVYPCGSPTVPNIVFPQPSTAPAFTPIFGTTGPAPTNTFANVAAFQAACPGAGGAAQATTLDPMFVNPIVHQYDIAYERELPGKFSASVSYIGSRANHLPVFVDANLSPPTSTATYLIFDGSGNPLSPTTVTVPLFTTPRPRTNPATGKPLGVVLVGKSVINSWYNGLVLRIRRRETHGFSLDANFTYSQARDNGQVAGVNGTFTGTVSPLNPFDLRSEYGLSEIDVRKRFGLTLYWLTPFDKWTDNAGLKALVGGWKLASVLHISDGAPVIANLNGRPSCSTGDGGLTCGTVNSNGGPTNGRIPFIERNTQFTTPSVAAVDLRIAREFKITERSTFEFIWEAFNLFNRTNAVGGNSSPVQNRAFDFVSAGTVAKGPNPISNTPAKCPVVGTVAGVPDFNGCLVQHMPPHTGAADQFLVIQSTSNTLLTARQIQFGAKFRF